MARGARRHRVRLEHPGDPVADGKGGFTETWAPLVPAEWWCSIRAASTQMVERLTAGTMQATATHLVRGDFHSGITTESRVIFEGRTLQVQSVTDVDERHVKLILICAEVVGGGAEPTSNKRARGTSGGVARGTA